MHTRILPTLLLLAACNGPDATLQTAAASPQPPLIARELIARRIASLADDSFPLFRPIRIRLFGDTLVVADVGDDRVALFDSGLVLLHTFGRSGAGPGELQGPVDLASWKGLIAVGDMTNQRVSFFRPDGALVREVPLRQVLRSFVIGDDGSLYHVSTTSYDTYFTLIAPDDSRRPWGARPPGLVRDTTSPEGFVELDDVLAVRTPDRAIHVLDNRQGVLVRLDSAGAVQRTARLPESLLEPIRERHEGLTRSFARQGVRVLPGTIAKDFTATADGRLLISLASRDVVGIIIDPATYEIREIRVPGEAGPWDAARRASSMALRDGVLYAVTQEGVYAFALEEGRDG